MTRGSHDFVPDGRAGIDKTIAELIVEWQACGQPESFSLLANATSRLIELTATKHLHRARFCTPVVVDEIRSRVWDHLRRLHAAADKEQSVAPFRPDVGTGGDAGVRYVRWITRRRLLDVVREERRRIRRAPTMTEARVDDRAIVARARWQPGGQRPDSASEADLRRATEALPAPRRWLVEMLLRGQPQVAIAKELRVSEATISRLRRDTFAQLRSMLAGDPKTGILATGRDSAPPSRPNATPATALPLVTIQYRVRADTNIVLSRRYQWYAFGCLLDGDVSLTWSRQGKERTSRQTVGTCNFFVPDKATSEFRWHPSRETTFHTILVPPGYFEDVVCAEGIRTAAPFHPLFGFADRDIATRIRGIGRHRESGDRFAQECRGRSLVLRMLELQGCGAADWRRDESVFSTSETKRLGEYVEANLRGGVTLGDMARVPGLSPSHFNRKFRRSFGVTPSRFVAVRRVQRVVDLLRTTDDSVAGIASRAGFCSTSHCTNAFRGMLGMPPSRFRAEVLFPRKSQPAPAGAG